jgi:hypothetical protein
MNLRHPQELKERMKNLVGKSERKSFTTGTPRRKREDNINTYFKETGCEDVELIKLVGARIRRHVSVSSVIVLLAGNYLSV